MRAKSFVGLVGLCFAATLHASPNLLLNSSFDADFVGWHPSSAVATYVHTNTGGAVQVSQSAATGGQTISTIGQCRPAQEGQIYSASSMVFNTQQVFDPSGTVGIYFIWYADSSCAGAALRVDATAKAPRGAYNADSLQLARKIAPGSTHSVQVLFGVNRPGGHAEYSAVFDDVFFGTGYCANTLLSACLNSRFEVTALWETDAHHGDGVVVPQRESTSAFWFFGPDNLEVLVKVLDGCAVNNRHWVFAGGLTNVRTFITVNDRKAGGVKIYENPQGTAFKPIQDTGAFATCP